MKANLLKFFSAFSAALVLLPVLALAQTAVTIQTSQQRCDAFKAQFNHAFDWVSSQYCTASGLALYVINILLTMAGSVTIVMLMVGGFFYLTSSGNEEQAEKGRKIITNAIIGLVVIILADTIVRIITNTLLKTQ